MTCYSKQPASEAVLGQGIFQVSQILDARQWLPLLAMGRQAAQIRVLATKSDERGSVMDVQQGMKQNQDRSSINTKNM